MCTNNKKVREETLIFPANKIPSNYVRRIFLISEPWKNKVYIFDNRFKTSSF